MPVDPVLAEVDVLGRPLLALPELVELGVAEELEVAAVDAAPASAGSPVARKSSRVAISLRLVTESSAAAGSVVALSGPGSIGSVATLSALAMHHAANRQPPEQTMQLGPEEGPLDAIHRQHRIDQNELPARQRFAGGHVARNSDREQPGHRAVAPPRRRA